MLVSDLIAKARELLVDPDKVRWTDNELMSWLDSAYQQVILHRPDANSSLITHTCVPGPLQTLDSKLNGPLLLAVKRNILTDANGNTSPGVPVRLVSITLADTLIDTWYAAPASSDGQVLEYMYDERTPRQFYVYPNATDKTKLELLVSTIPTPHSDVSESIAINNRYFGVLLDYVLYRAYLRDASTTHAKDLAITHLRSFADTLGIKLSVDNAITPIAITGAVQ